MLAEWKDRVRALKRELSALVLAMRRPDVPWYAKALGAVVIAYALSPIDLIPDFIPVLGLLDDLILVPLGVLAVRAMVPAEVLVECRERARELETRPRSRAGAAVVVAVWLAVAAAGAWLFIQWWQ